MPRATASAVADWRPSTGQRSGERRKTHGMAESPAAQAAPRVADYAMNLLTHDATLPATQLDSTTERERSILPQPRARESPGERLARRRDHAALGDQPGDQPRRRHVEAVVGDRASRPERCARSRCGRRRCGRRWSSTSSALRCSIGISATPSVTVKSMRRRRQRHIERHAVVLGRERLEIGADLVADVAVAR